METFFLDILNEGMSLEDINYTHIVLNPKTSNPISMQFFHLISICLVLYKIISKTMVNRFQKVLNWCIDEAQNAFVPGRLITDNILLVYEILEVFKRKRYGKKRSFRVQIRYEKDI